MNARFWPGRIISSTLVVAFMILTPTAAQSQAQVRRVIWFENDCSRSVRFIINHADTWRSWHSHGWWTFRPYQASTLSADGVVLSQLDDHALYIYGETTDGEFFWQGGGPSVDFRGTQYNLYKVPTTVTSGQIAVRLTC